MTPGMVRSPTGNPSATQAPAGRVYLTRTARRLANRGASFTAA